VPKELASGMKGTALRLFRGLAHSYDATVDFATLFQDRYWKRWVAERTPAGLGDLVLDVGCGTLLMEERLSGWKCRFVGLDLTDEMLRSGQSKGLPNVALLTRGDAESLPFPDGIFDAVISCYVPKYVSVCRFASELARVTRTGGVVAIYDFARPRGPLGPIIEIYIQGGLRAGGFLLGLARNGVAFTFTNLPKIVDRTVWDKEILRAMEEEGFETTAAERLTGGVVFAFCGRKGRLVVGSD
jgi:demethylmenaquinone methyltransferase / 2-methoxy-6-polyprenyl-1,4-benzoquinol methylase